MCSEEGEVLDALVEGARSGGRGRKLQAEDGRADTRVKISEIRRCWTAVSCDDESVSWLV